MKYLTRSSLLLTCILLAIRTVSAQEEKDTFSLEDLKSKIEIIMEESGVPSVGIALVDSLGPVWVEGLGLANVEEEKEADRQTIYRIGSISKMFVSLAVLKLQEEKRLNLQDKVRDLVPEIEYENRWSETHPVRVAHLLEHTTGWDDIHLPEYGSNDPKPLTLKEGLDFHPHSRISRWPPGTRMAYCNAGPPVAAYIVEKVTGMDFEEYVRQQFWQPMGMESMTYRLSAEYERLGATLYEDGRAVPYWHIIMRPSGSINASPVDMARMVKFFIDRGRADSLRIMGEASLNRLERPSTTSGARA
ncbi:MAG: serine hydrolase domain-containing protein, partial [Saprospiraceae bacterium]|nr:serine hydrolase domain-containing protein [Saprospiraceae bacterium]